jgi:uncharacterized membrane protein
MLAVDIVEIAVAKLGFSPSVAGIVLALVILGSTINIPLYRVESPTVVAENFTRTCREILYQLSWNNGDVPFGQCFRTLPEELVLF